MLINDTVKIGAKLLVLRKSLGLTQAQVAELAGIADRTYADIERGTVDMRVGTMLALCSALGVTPNDILIQSDTGRQNKPDIMKRLGSFPEKYRSGAEKIISAYLEAIE